jgi:molybdate transport system substrate-binding protein
VTQRPVPTLALVFVLLAACTGPSAADGGRRSPVTVLAAASLTETFTELGKQFEAAHPGARVEFSFGASSALARQLTDGAPADVFAAANPETMASVRSVVAGAPQVFARNRLVIAVPAGNPGRVRGLADFARPRLRIAVCAPQVPCGSAARKAFAAAGVTPRPDTLEQDVKAALAKVVSGEVDAALVYRTDAGVPGVQSIEFPAAARALNDYQVAVLREATDAADARAFRDFVLSPAAWKVLSAAGFEAP